MATDDDSNAKGASDPNADTRSARIAEEKVAAEGHSSATVPPVQSKNAAIVRTGPPDVISSQSMHGTTHDGNNVHFESGETSVPSSSSKDTPADKRRRKPLRQRIQLPECVTWIGPIVTDWSKVKPIIRSGLSAWICMLFMIILPVERAMGNASFIILIGVFIQPAELPFAAVIEREFFTLLLTCTAWAYANLATFFAHLARTNRLTPAETDPRAVFQGRYIETAPTAICTTFLAIGVALTLYLKVKFGPSPFVFATILTCITLDITLMYAPFFPYPNYQLGQQTVIPLAIKSGVVSLVSCFVFPKSTSSAFVEAMIRLLDPLAAAIEGLQQELQKSPLDPTFNFDVVRDKVAQSEAALIPLVGQARLVAREINFSLASAQDLKSLVLFVRQLLAPADGVSFYFSLIKSDLRGMQFEHATSSEKLQALSNFTLTPDPSRPPSPSQSQPGTPHPELDIESTDMSSVDSQQNEHRVSNRSASGIAASSHRHPFELRRRLHELRQPHSVAYHKRHHQHRRYDVGTWESLRYSAFETQHHGRSNDHITETCMRILADISSDLLKSQSAAYSDMRLWLSMLNKRRTRRSRDLLTLRSLKVSEPFLKHPDGSPKLLAETIEDLERALVRFKEQKQAIIEPFRHSVEENAASGGDHGERWPHRYLFQCLTFCHFQILYTTRVLDLLRKLDDIEQRRKSWRIWLPDIKFDKWDAWKSFTFLHEETDEHDEDPETIPGITPTTLGRTRARDPDALESDSKLQSIGVRVSEFLHSLYRGHALFMIKAGVTTVLVALPSILSSTAGWAYDNKAIWAVFLSQLVASRHRGEVLFGLVSRTIATALGAIMGLLVWYIASGKGIANPFALAVVTAFAFPIAMMGRIFYPGPPITSIITCVTFAMIVGYSWKNATDPTLGYNGVGWEVAWRRFVEVLIGAGAAYIMAILPPSSSIRTYYRLSHATIVRETGNLFCELISTASLAHPSLSSPSMSNVRHRSAHPDPRQLLEHLIAVRSKVRRLGTLKSPIAFEWSLRGRWPLKRYETLERIELRLLRLFTHATTIYMALGPAYSRALLLRTHFLDPTFLGDCIAVLSMCATSLATGQPLPQIAPVLIDRYMRRPMGFKVRRGDTLLSKPAGKESTSGAAKVESTHPHEATKAMPAGDDSYSLSHLPHKITFETLCDEQYQTFAVGASVAFGITVHLDKLCVAVKDLVGETFSVPADLRSYNSHAYT